LLSVQSRSSHSFTHFHKNNIHNKKTTKLPTFQCYAKAPNNRKERINRKETTNKENDGTTTSGKHRHKAKLLSGRAVSRRKAISSAIVAAAAFNTAAYALQIESVVTDGCVIHEGVVTNIQKKKKKKKKGTNTMRIAVIAWGSLAWQFAQPGREKLLVVGDTERFPGKEACSSFQPGGPSLPLEFSRVSLDGRLTLVLDANAAPQSTLYATHKSDNLKDAISNLERREMPISSRTHDEEPTPFQKKAIGYVDITHNKHQCQSKQLCTIIQNWCRENNYDAAIWWDAPSNFVDKKGVEFSLDEGMNYLNTIEGEQREKALDYIRNSLVETGSGIKHLVMDAFG